MYKGILIAAILVLSGCASGPTHAELVDAEGQPELEVSLTAVLEQVEGRDASDFVVGKGVDSSIAAGSWDGESIDYPRLLNILANNNVAALEVDGTVNLVPFHRVRSMPVPAFEASEDQPETAWAWHVTDTGDMDAAQMVPILRPLIPQPGHLAAHGESGKMIILAPRGNIANLLEIVASLQ